MRRTTSTAWHGATSEIGLWRSLPCMRRRLWRCRRCSYRSPRMRRGRRCMRRWWRGSVCWDLDRRRTQQKRPGASDYTGSHTQHLQKRLCPHLIGGRLNRTSHGERYTSKVCRQGSASSRGLKITKPRSGWSGESGLLGERPMALLPQAGTSIKGTKLNRQEHP